MAWKIIVIILICALPAATLILTAIYHFSPEYHNPLFFRPFPPLLTSFASLTAIYALALVVLLAILNLKSKELVQKIKSLEKFNTDLIKQTHELQSKIELLSAGREISLIINEEVDFETIIGKALEITAHLSNPNREAEEVTIFLKQEKKNKLVPIAQRTGGKTYFEEELRSMSINDKNVQDAFEHQRLFLAAGSEEFDFSVPLVADREAVGVIKVKTILEGEIDKRIEKTRQLQTNLMEFAKIIALTIKTPALYARAITDPLTGFFSKRHFFTQIQTYFELSHRYKQPFSLAMIDIDHFKRINDTYGHPTGDFVLKELAKLVEQNIRKASSAYRYGGEEFAIILPNTTKEGAFTMADRLRHKIEAHRITTPEGANIKMTISVGIAEYSTEQKEFQQLIVQADNALYKAKQSGRNKVLVF